MISVSHKLTDGNALARWRQQPDIFDLLNRAAILRLVANHQIVALLAFEHLRHGLAADRGFNRVLHVADVDAEAIGLDSIDHQVQIRLPDGAKDSEIGDAANLAHHADDLVPLLFERRQIGAVNLHRELAFDAADRLFHVVGDGLREVPHHAGNHRNFLVQRFDQSGLVLMEHRPPLFFRAAGRRSIRC